VHGLAGKPAWMDEPNLTQSCPSVGGCGAACAGASTGFRTQVFVEVTTVVRCGCATALKTRRTSTPTRHCELDWPIDQGGFRDGACYGVKPLNGAEGTMDYVLAYNLIRAVMVRTPCKKTLPSPAQLQRCPAGCQRVYPPLLVFAEVLVVVACLTHCWSR